MSARYPLAAPKRKSFCHTCGLDSVLSIPRNFFAISLATVFFSRSVSIALSSAAAIRSPGICFCFNAAAIWYAPHLAKRNLSAAKESANLSLSTNLFSTKYSTARAASSSLAPCLCMYSRASYSLFSLREHNAIKRLNIIAYSSVIAPSLNPRCIDRTLS